MNKQFSREVADHLARRTAELEAQGVAAAEARRRASAEFGSAEAVAEEMREAGRSRPGGWLADAAQDVRFALRSWRRAPAFAATALAILALGLGANAAMFGVLQATLLRPLPFRDPGRLVYFTEFDNKGNEQSLSIPDLRDFAAQNRVFAAVGGYRDVPYTLTAPTQTPETIPVRLMFQGAFQTLGVRPYLGRGFVAHDHQPKGPPDVVLSYDFWQSHFGGTPNVVGKTVAVVSSAGVPQTWTVVGVMPPDFRYGRQTAMYAPYEQAVPAIMFTARQYSWWLYGVARLKPGVSLAAARADVGGISARLARTYPATNASVHATIQPLREELTGGVGASLWMVFAGVTLLLLIVCVNLANLLLARAAGRANEMAVRAALGAGRGRLARQLLAEGLLLSLLGGGLGAALVLLGLRATAAALPASFPVVGALGLSPLLAAYILVLALATGILFSLAPIFFATRTHFRSRAAAGRHRLHSTLIVVEVGLAMALLAASGLMLRSLSALNRVDLGFQPHHLLVLGVPPSGRRTRAQAQAFTASLRAGAAGIPGVEETALGAPVPYTPQIAQLSLAIENHPAEPQQPLGVWAVICGPNYFHTIGMPLLRGRRFTAADTLPGAPSVVIVDKTLADQYWGSPERALGSHVQAGVTTFGAAGLPVATVVGVVGPVRAEGADIAPHREMYLPSTGGALVVRTAGDPARLEPALRALVHRLAPASAPPTFQTMDSLIAAAEGTRQISTRLLTAFGLGALLLAGLGLYGVLAFLVQQRRRELGIRIALGATRAELARLVFGQGLRLGLLGLGLGAVASMALGRGLRGLLFATPAADPLTLAAVAGVLLAAVAVASYLPARRAAGLDPLTVLRSE